MDIAALKDEDAAKENLKNAKSEFEILVQQEQEIDRKTKEQQRKLKVAQKKIEKVKNTRKKLKSKLAPGLKALFDHAQSSNKL